MTRVSVGSKYSCRCSGGMYVPRRSCFTGAFNCTTLFMYVTFLLESFKVMGAQQSGGKGCAPVSRGGQGDGPATLS